MGRTLKRVPMDFAWPLGQVWEGYLNPHHTATSCPCCEGGYSADYKRLEALWYSHKGGGFRPEMRGSTPFKPEDELVKQIITAKVNRDLDARLFYGTNAAAIHREAMRMCEIWNSSWSHHLNELDVAALIAEDRLCDFTSTFTPSEGWKQKEPPYIPTPKEVNEWSLCGLGHDSLNCWIVVKAELARLGLPWTCDHCKGDGELWQNEQDRQTYEAWEPSEPPSGDGYQLWETTSEGSPSSPVFPSLDALCEWCATGATTFGKARATASEWRQMLDDGFVCHREGNSIFI